jgi:hypothetical protein
MTAKIQQCLKRPAKVRLRSRGVPWIGMKSLVRLQREPADSFHHPTDPGCSLRDDFRS